MFPSKVSLNRVLAEVRAPATNTNVNIDLPVLSELQQELERLKLRLATLETFHAQPVFKRIPLSLTAGQHDITATGAWLTGRTLVVPMKWGAVVKRFRIHVRNVNPRTGATGSSIPVSIAKIGKQGAGVISNPTSLNLTANVTGESEYISDWIDYTLEANVDYGLEISYTAKSTDVIYLNAGGSYVVPSSGAPWVSNSTPFHIWLEAEIAQSVPVYTFIGDSLTAGIGASSDRSGHIPMYNSWPAMLSRLHGALPVMYASSGDTMMSWTTEENPYKLTVWDSGYDKGDVLWLNMGSNDVFAGSGLEAIKSRQVALSALMRRRVKDDALVITTAILPRNTHPGTAETEQARVSYNTWLSGLPSEVGARKHVDFISAISGDNDSIPQELSGDGVHLTTGGYEMIARRVNELAPLDSLNS